MEYRNVPNLRDVLTAASIWMAALAVLAAYTAFGSRATGESVALGAVSGLTLAGAVVFARFAFSNLGSGVEEMVAARVNNRPVFQRNQSNRKAA